VNTSGHFLLRIPDLLYEEMLAHAIGELPNECCGLLVGTINDEGTVGEVTHRYPLVNALQSATEFLSEPKNMFAAQKDMRSRGIKELAVYHSHPSTAPTPSKRDLERNYAISVMNLIIGFAGGSPEVRGWWLTDESFYEGEWEVV